jgi:hypothetical protein
MLPSCISENDDGGAPIRRREVHEHHQKTIYSTATAAKF